MTSLPDKAQGESATNINTLNVVEVICTSTFDSVHPHFRPHAVLSRSRMWCSELRRRGAKGEVRMFILIHILTLISPWWKYSSPETIMTLIWALGMSLFC